MRSYEWQDGDYILTAELPEDDYHEAARQWMSAGVRKGEYPSRWQIGALSAFGVKGGHLYHGDTWGSGSFVNGRRVKLINGRLQVANEAPDRTPGGRPMRLNIEIPGTTTVHEVGDALDALNARVVGVHEGGVDATGGHHD